MKSKWCFSALIIILTLFGAISKQQVTVPNQEIVLQFTSVSITSEATQNTIAIVKKQLQSLGASHIKVKETGSGKLKISYYSDTDVACIKETFSADNNLSFEYVFNNQDKDSSKLPFKDGQVSYNLDIYEIHDGNTSEWDLNGVFVLDLKSKTFRFSNPNIHVFISVFEVNENIEKVAYTTHWNIAINIDNSSHKIPEVRAGPIA